MKPYGQYEYLHPDELSAIIAQAPIAYVPLGTFEHHGFHLPVSFDAIKAHALCMGAARRTGGAVLPPFFYGTGGGHSGYMWTIIVPESLIRTLLAETLDGLANFGFKTVVVLTGHYPSEQVNMVHSLACEAGDRNPGVRFMGLAEPEITTPLPGDAYGGDHAAQYETSIAWALNPDWVQLERLVPHDPRTTALPTTLVGDESMRDPGHPLYAIYGKDPRQFASRELGEKLVTEITDRLVQLVTAISS